MYENCGSQVQLMCGSAGSCEVDYAEALARWAKIELLKEKVKKRLDKRYGEKLDRVADLIVELAVEQARSEEEMESKREQLEDELDSLSAGEQEAGSTEEE